MASTAIATREVLAGRWSTPRVLRSMRLVLLLLDVSLLLLLSFAVAEQREALHTLMNGSVPAISAAQHITAAMADMDTDAGRSLRDEAAGRHASTDAFEADRRQEVLALLRAAETVRGEGQATAAIEALELQQGVYEQMLQRARDLHEQGAPAAPVYEAAARLMDGTLLPAAAALERTGREQMEGAFAAEEEHVHEARAVLGLAWLVTLGGLLTAQVYLSQRMRRTLNLPLLGATLWTAALGLQLMQRSAAEQEKLAAARSTAVDGMALAGQARAAAHLAYRAQVRSLLSGTAGGEMPRRAFVLEADRVATVPAGLSTEQLANALWQRQTIDGLSGALPALLSRTPQRTERSDLIAALLAWERLRAAALPAAGLHADSVTRGRDEAAVPRELAAFDQALNSAAASEDETLDREARAAAATGTGLELEAGAGVCVLAGLLLLGFHPRLREYL